jgi:D-serine deaminase-like pyridoxal phosphate-dependent protein
VTVDDLDTPALFVDLDAVERNIDRMQRYCDEHGIALRPHIKTHKLPALAHRQIAAGARGIACQKLGEAEVMTAAGVRDVTVTFPLVGRAKAERFAALAAEHAITAVGDSLAVAEGLSAALVRAGTRARFLVDCDTGLGRTGVQSPAEAVELARAVDRLPGLVYAGVLTYPTTPDAGPTFAAMRDAVEAAGMPVETVSGGGTPNALRTHELPFVTELRVGTYVYGDRACLTDGTVSLDDCALRVRATVVSRPTGGRAILDAGSKALSSDPVGGHPSADGFGLVVEHPRARIYALNEEHGYVDVGECPEPPRVGDVVTIVPNHACAVTKLHDTVVARRAGRVVATWEVAARGRLA